MIDLKSSLSSTEVVNALAQDATKALLYEVSVNPKPGLVDPISSGPHPDMDVFTFIDSALALQKYFQQVANLAINFEKTLPEMFIELRELGKEAEKTMLMATNGVNTHKGAIFSLTIMIAAEAHVYRYGGELRPTIQEMLQGLTKNDFQNVESKNPNELTAGERQFLSLGYAGIRGEAEKGYPIVFDDGYPMLKKTAGTRNQRLMDTFLKIVSVNIDSNLIKRANNDPAIVKWAQNQAIKVMELGGSKTSAGRNQLEKMNQEFLNRNLSLGGSADLLALTIFLGLRRGILDFEGKVEA